MADILLIEDNMEIQENTAELLELEGYQVTVAKDGKTGIELATGNPPDLVLCDIQMPEADGYEVLEALKNNPATADIPFIFLTASAEPSEKQEGLDRGADEYIRKPFEVERLLDAISGCLKRE